MAYNMLGHINRYCGNKVAAKRNFNTVLSMMEEAGYYESMPPIYMNLVNVSLNDDHEEAMRLLDKAREIAVEYSPERVFDIDTRKTVSYFNDGNIEKFLKGYEAYKDYKSVMDKNPGLVPWNTLKKYMMKKHGVDADTWDLGHKAYDNMKKYGDMTWYSWCSYHWGTKWNAYECTMWEEGHVFQFETAWNSCYMIICALSKKFPDVKMILKFADEDIGYNTGIYTFLDDLFESELPEGGSTEAYELASRIWDIDLEDLGFEFDKEKGEYVYIEKEL